MIHLLAWYNNYMSYLKFKRPLILIAVGAVIAWAVILPALNKRSANEKLTDIAALDSDAKTANQNSSNQTDTPGPAPESDIKKLLSGSFKGINGQSSQGDILIVKIDGKNYVRLEDNFSVTNGPDLQLGLGNDNSVKELIGGLKANSGGQNYLIPDNLDINKYSQVFIHCRAFKYSFAVADLQKV